MAFSADKFVRRMFRRIDGIVWDVVSGQVGLKTAEGVFTATFSETGEPTVTVNPFDLSVALPGFATQTAHADVNVGDIIVGDQKILGWVTRKTDASFVLIDQHGMTKNYTPPKVAVMGGSGPLVVRNLFSLTGGQGGVASMLPMLMMFGGDDSKLEKILPFLLMQGGNLGAPAADGAAAAANPMAAMLPLLLMKGGLGGGNGDIDPMLLMAMSGGLGGGNGAMNPMLMMALMNGGLGGDSADAPPLVPTRRNAPPPLSTLSRY